MKPRPVHLADATPALAPAFTYTFDDIGNRLTAATSAPAAPAVAHTSVYTPNTLNQYTQRTVPAAVAVLGSV